LLAISLALACALALAVTPARAAGRVTTCVSVEAPADSQPGLEKLVRSELDAHPTHYAVDEGCDTQLTIELVTVPKQGTWLTGRINGQVPQRETVETSDLAPAVERLVSVLLHNDPVRLRGPAEASWVQERSRELQRGHLVLEGALAQSALWLGPRLQFLPGAMLGARREGDTFQLGGRLVGSFATQETAAELHADYRFAIELDAMFWSSREALTAFFGGPVVGWEVEQFEGPATLLEPGEKGDHIHHGPLVGLRGGVETLRAADARLFLALEVALPIIPAKDIDEGVIERWVPSTTLSVGLGF
jgi:hypothetical protein